MNLLERVRIWQNDSDNTHYEISAKDGSIIAHGAIPFNEWVELRRAAESLSEHRMVDLLAVLATYSLE